MAQYCHKWFCKEEPEGQEARRHETLEPVTGLEDKDTLYDNSTKQQRQPDPEAARSRHRETLESITGLEACSAYDRSNSQRHQPAAETAQLRRKQKPFPKDDDPWLPTSDSFHRRADAAQASGQQRPEIGVNSDDSALHGHSGGDQDVNGFRGAHLRSAQRSFPKDDDPRLPTSDSFHRLADAAQANGEHASHSGAPHSQAACGNDRPAGGHAAEILDSRPGPFAHQDNLATSQSDIMDSHAALMHGYPPAGSPMDDGLPNSQQAHAPADSHQSVLQQSHQQSSQQDHPQQNPQQSLHKDHHHQQQQQQQQQQQAMKLNDPGQADRHGPFGQDRRMQKQPAINCKVPLPFSCEAFWNGLAAVLAVAITALFIVLMIIDTGEQHEGRES